MTDPTDEVKRDRLAGALLLSARETARLSKRAAALKAGFSPTQWGDMERGLRSTGVPVRSSDQTLEAAALAVGLDPAELFAVAGRTYTPRQSYDEAADQAAALPSRLDDHEHRLLTIEERVERLERAAAAGGQQWAIAAESGSPDPNPGKAQHRPSPPAEDGEPDYDIDDPP